MFRFPVGCKRFLRSPAGPAFYSVGTGPRSPGMKGPEHEADHLLALSWYARGQLDGVHGDDYVCTWCKAFFSGKFLSVQSVEETLCMCSILFFCRNIQSRKQNLSEAACSPL